MSTDSVFVARNKSSADIASEHDEFDLTLIVQGDDDDAVLKEDHNVDDSSVALEVCKRSILKPYHKFLKMIGWRRFSSSGVTPKYPFIKKILNFVIPILFVIIVLIGSASQLLLCFGRSKTFTLPVNQTDLTYIRCDSNYVINEIIPFCLVISSYFFGLYIMRYSQVEHLSNLTEKIFLGYSDRVGQFSRKNLILRLRIFMSIGVTWLLLSVPLNLLRVYSLRLYSHNTYFYFITSKNVTYLEELYTQGKSPPSDHFTVQFIAIIFALIGYFVVDLSYIAAIINYSLQCQLITYLVNVTVKRICNSCYAIDQAIKEIKTIQEFLKVLNGGLANQMSLLIFLFMGVLISAIHNIFAAHDHNELQGLIIGIINAISWLFLLSFIIFQATKLTVVCEKIFNLGMELRSRPFMYANTSQLDLDSFLLYTTSIRMEAQLLHIPMKPHFVLPVCFTIAYFWRINGTLF